MEMDITTPTLGRFTSPALLILFCLKSDAKHGLEIISMLNEQCDIILEPGTLYAALARLEQRGWIMSLTNESPHRSYSLTDGGYAVLDSSRTILDEKLLYRLLAEHPPCLL